MQSAKLCFAAAGKKPWCTGSISWRSGASRPCVPKRSLGTSLFWLRGPNFLTLVELDGIQFCPVTQPESPVPMLLPTDETTIRCELTVHEIIPPRPRFESVLIMAFECNAAIWMEH